MASILNMGEITSAAQLSSHPARPPISILSLPPELLSQIATLLTRYDAISFALTSRKFLAPSEPHILHHLDLCGSIHFGERPWVQPFVENDGEEYWEWVQGEAKVIGGLRTLGLAHKVRRVLLGTSELQLGMIQRMTVPAYSARSHGPLQLLEMTSHHLRSLTIEVNDWSPMLNRSTLEAWTSPLVMSIRIGSLQLPTLTHLSLGTDAINSPICFLVLCDVCPNLITLESGATYYVAPTFEMETTLGKSLIQPTKIRRMRIPFCDLEEDAGDDAQNRAVEPLLALLEASPALTQLSATWFDRIQSILALFPRFLARHSNLRDLHISLGVEELDKWTSEKGPITCVRRLVLEAYHWSDVSYLPSRLPNLELLCYLRPIPDPKDYTVHPSFRPAIPCSAYSMLPTLASQLRLTPHLRYMQLLDYHFDRYIDFKFSTFDGLSDIASAGTSTGRIRSFCRDEGELLNASFWMEYLEISDEAGVDGVSDDEIFDHWDIPVIRYDARDGTSRLKTYVRLPKPVLAEYTDFEGMMVPMEIIERMRVVEGVTEAEWQGRGIEVGEEAWRVLTDWKEQADADESKVGAESTYWSGQDHRFNIGIPS